MPKSPDFDERKKRQTVDGKIAMAEYLSQAEQVKRRTAELRAARLAREAAPQPEEKSLRKKPFKRKTK